MALFIKDRIYLQITVGDVDLPLDKLNVLQHLHIVESVRCYLPQLTFTYTDATKFVAVNNLFVEGAIIKVSVGLNSAQRVYEFRMFHVKDTLGDGGTVYQVSAYLNVPKYWIESTAKAINGTASNAIKQIAEACGLRYDGVSTADSQLWLPYNTRHCEFVRQISERAYIDEQSCVQLAVLGDKRLRLFNVTEFDSRQSREQFSNQSQGGSMLPIIDFNVLSKGGFFNAQSGYQDTRVSQSMVSTLYQDIGQLTVKRNSTRLNMNKDVKGVIEQGKVTFAPLDVGNVSETYEKALYQNRRLSNLFTFGAEFNTNDLIESEVLDYVTCEFSKPDLQGIKQISGKFVLTSKVLYVTGINLFQKCEVYRHGQNASRDTTQV